MGTPVASTLGPGPERLGLKGGKAWVEDCGADDGIVPPDEASGRGGGLIGYIWDVRREAGVEDWRDVDGT
jgi:hypothetical protein